MTASDSIDILSGLSPIADRYDGIICDVWGVLHNGVIGYAAASEALATFRKTTGRPVVLLTNAPRPAALVADILDGFGVSREAYDSIVTSGDVAREAIEEKIDVPAFFIGPERDLPLFSDLSPNLVDEAEADLILCTGLFDDDVETPDDYRDRLQVLASRGATMICANPDIVVERGDRLIYCAGALAQLYAELGGPTIMVGKPYKPVYDAALARISGHAGKALAFDRLLAIGDALATDVRGGWGQGMDVLLVTAGIHAADFGPVETPDPEKIAKRLAIEGLAAVAAVPRLRW
ncbi:Ribonucleotide monophosphatase NagD [Hartmannibacter diazotrophicus]|uniref:Ribonucleotide monophosphatase NagD n=1 Tax=Hartmannibacter diazotrophicus TaxID=1482074 RepID=A0A2C9D2R6_9HYPH|nr:TIGR01459 family HAD-type hydrolase [Hartmannibacter diazotrophicus]SON54627.1 Ribonucleotide monophosphatase NagD [Hartmannibacter diazotrophicus]